MNQWFLKLPENKSPELDGLPGEFYQTFREELMPIILKLSHKIAEKGMLPNTFYKASITLIAKPDKDTKKKKKKKNERKKENYRPISLMNTDAKMCNKILAKWNHQYIKKIIHQIKWNLFQGCKDFSVSTNQCNKTKLTNWKIKITWSYQ